MPASPSPAGAPARWLLLRGLGRQRGHWFEFPRLLEAALGVEALALDLPGSGTRRHERSPGSIPAIARALLAKLQDSTPATPGNPAASELPHGVIGISLGAMVALSLAEQWPSAISHVVVINTSSRLSFGHQRLRPRAALALLRASCLGAGEVEARERLLYALTTSGSEPDIARWARDAAQLAERAPPRRRTLLAQLLAAGTFRAPDRLEQPLLVLSGARDRLVSPGCSSALARRLGGAQRCHPTAGHDLPLEQPRWVIEQLRGWLATGSAGSQG